MPRDRETGEPLHTLPNVYGEMLAQICRDYPGLPDPRTLSMGEIRWFYEPLRDELKRYSAPKPPSPSPAKRPPRTRKKA